MAEHLEVARTQVLDSYNIKTMLDKWIKSLNFTVNKIEVINL